jgi:hypothetical protein
MVAEAAATKREEKMSDDKKKVEATEEGDNEHLDSRRNVLRKILIAGGIGAGASFLPEKWTKPVVDFIVVPAYAAGSGTTVPTMTTG